MAKDIKQVNDAWKMLGINQEVLNAAQDVSSVANSRQADYWERAVEFLTELEQKTFFELSKKQENWAKGIVLQLESEHGYTF